MFDVDLSNKKIIKSRQVYDIITFVAEISGFADLFMVFTTLVLGTFIQPQSLEKALLEHMRPVRMRGKKKKRPDAHSLDFEQSVSISKEMLLSMIIEQRNRVSLRINVWMTLFARYIPSRYRSGHTNRILKLAERSMTRMEQTLDVKNIIQQRDDVQILLKQLLNAK